ncbi:transcription initiation factor TFIID subunit 11 isoform X1 [Arachis duranensis]|uniref:Transcription initiation factor TFIID subunit 11 isoform X1 n=2 Tax=Arachis duranensis TaxID=130453 RepID=A0A9C6T4Y9_ARADU|nr:transcription initiation factor TFIID subunit 11 isoform X1 [Arachis duranensis]
MLMHTERMKQSKDPFEAAFEEQEDSPPESPADTAVDALQNPNSSIVAHNSQSQPQDQLQLPHDDNAKKGASQFTPLSGSGRTNASSSGPFTATTGAGGSGTGMKSKEEEEEEEEENMDVELGKFPSSGDPDKMAKMQAILSQFTEEQMSRYESFRRAGFQKSNMKRLLASITGTQKISVPMTIVVSGIAKMFVGEVVETARIVMQERKESGPIRPCHLREAYRRLKLEGKVFKRPMSRLFR